MGILTSKRASITVLIVTQVAVLSLWFSAAAVLSDMARESGLSSAELAPLSTAVQFGFAGGALIYALFGFADRFDPRAVFTVSALGAAAANLALLIVPIGGWEAICLRGLTGAMMAGVYPVGMKIATGWGKQDRAFLIGSLVGALTLGSASPHIISFIGGTDWRLTIWTSTILASAGAFAVLAISLGPHHASARRLDITAISLTWTDRRIRLAVIGYIGHMWELYAFWAWVAVFAAGSFKLAGAENAASLGKLTAFAAIGLGGLACVPGGWLADRFGRPQVAKFCLMVSGGAAIASALLYGGPVWPMLAVLIVWGLAIVPDSALYSTMVADAAPPDRAGSLLTVQNALGFLLTAFTVQGAPALAAVIGWPWVLAVMSLGPGAGIWALQRLLKG